MASKERKGGLLRNEDIEKELERTGANDENNRGYRGTQDTGDDVVRDKGTQVQQQDGTGDDEPGDRYSETGADVHLDSTFLQP